MALLQLRQHSLTSERLTQQVNQVLLDLLTDAHLHVHKHAQHMGKCISSAECSIFGTFSCLYTDQYIEHYSDMNEASKSGTLHS